MFKFISLSIALTLTQQVQAADYCVAIRGNGENVAAHWGGLSRMIEDMGLPKAAAGGSSASMTLFLLESLASNPEINALPSEQERNQAQALMLKTLPQYYYELANRDNLVSTAQFVKDLKNNPSKRSQLKTLIKELRAGTTGHVASTADLYLQILNPVLRSGLLSTSKKIRSHFTQQLNDNLAVFGSFDAVNDQNIFFRPGLVDFKYFAVITGTIGDFLAGQSSRQTRALLKSFVNSCASKAYRTEWQDQSLGDCRAQFGEVVQSYIRRPGRNRINQYAHRSLFSQVGTRSPILILPTTSVLGGASLEKYRATKAQFLKGEKINSNFVADYSDMAYGYWGSSPTQLEALRKNLIAQNTDADGTVDLKSSKFRSLGPANWFEVLSTSPAEPGLENFQDIPVSASREQILGELTKPLELLRGRWNKLSYRKDLISSGGWSDLHPTLVLRAAGCENVVYLTRKGGDSKFGQQIFMRMTGQTTDIPFWKNLKPQNDTGWDVAGTLAEKTYWNQISNLGNPKSSYLRSIRAADAIFCTDWDRFTINGYEPTVAMVKQAYDSSMVTVGPTEFSKSLIQLGLKVDTQSLIPGCSLPKN